MFIDSHAHLTSEALADSADAIAARAKLAGISAIVNICTDIASLEKGLELAERCPWIYNSAATTPHDVAKEGEMYFAAMAAAAHSGKLVAVGETGLDYYYEHSDRGLQSHFLKLYLQLALESRLPVIIHCRDAFQDLFKIIDSHYASGGKLAPGVLHCFTGTLQEALEVVARGWYVSLSGIVTFKKSEQLRSAAAAIPLSQLLIETDAPYLAPQSKRGKTNEPAYLPEIAAAIAAVKGITLEEVASATAANARRLFNLP